MSLSITVSFVLVTCLFFSCSKPTTEPTQNFTAPVTSFEPIPLPPPADTSRLILVDASKDGGVWWFPQVAPFAADLPHQGKPLVDYLRSRGFVVHELPRGVTVTWPLLKKYRKIIRAVAFSSYSPIELAAYDSLLQLPSSLLLLADHMQYTSNDALSAQLGLQFTGSYTGTLTASTNHEITSGVYYLPFIAGSVLRNPDLTKISVLGYANTYAAMGIVHHPTARIFFMGDANGIEQLPQPFTANLVKWLFQ